MLNISAIVRSLLVAVNAENNTILPFSLSKGNILIYLTDSP